MMRNFITAILFFVFITGCRENTPAPKDYPDYKNISKTEFPEIDERLIDNLEVLGKVWGFVKYHHPVFADSIFRIEPELFELLPIITGAEKQERNEILYKWIKSLGTFKSKPSLHNHITSSPDCFPTADVSWIESEDLLGKKLSRLLKKLRYAERRTNIYVNYDNDDMPLPLTLRRSYKSGGKFVDTGNRLLALYEYWNIIEYFSPYRNLTDKNWSEVLREYIPQFLSPGKETYEMVLSRLVAETNDSHSWHEGWFPGPFMIPLSCSFIDNRLYVKDTVTYFGMGKNYFMPGDEILKINGRTPADIIEWAGKYIASSNENTLKRDAALFGQYVRAQSVIVEIMRGGKTESFTMEAFPPYEIFERHYYRENIFRFDNGIGYIVPAIVDVELNLPELKKQIDNTDYLIIDVRKRPSLLPVICWDFFEREPGIKTIISEPRTLLPGWYELVPQDIRGNPEAYGGQIVVLVNENTQSMAEYMTMILQASAQAIVIGSQTAGADGNIAYLDLPGEITAMITGIGVYYPDGTPTQRVGIKIDHYVETTVQGIKEGRDEVLEYAINLINSRLGTED